MKTKVILVGSSDNDKLGKGDEGYIDGYITILGDLPYAIVVSGNIIDMVQLSALEVKLN